MRSAPIITLLSERAKDEIKKQLTHLDTIKIEGDEALQFKYMFAGAKTLLNIIEDEPISTQGTDNFLNNLDRSQLEYAISSAKAILKKKTSRGYVELFGVYSTAMRAEWFSEFDLAKKAYLERAEINFTKADFLELKVSMERRNVPIEDIHDYLKLNEDEIKDLINLKVVIND